MMGPAMRVGLDKLRFVTQDIGGGFGNKITSHPQLVACCLLARKLKRPVQWTEWRTDFHLSMSHGNERWFQDTEVAIKDDGTLLGFRTTALDDAGAWLRYEPLGGVIWAQVTPGMYRWRNIRLDFKQVVTNKAPVSPNRGYSRMQHLWFTERIIDIVAHELGLDPVEVREAQLHQDRGDAVRDAKRLHLRLGDYSKMLDTALELIGYDGLESRRTNAESRRKLLGLGIGSTLDSGTNNFGQSRLINPELQFSGNNEVATVKLDIFGEIVVTLGTTPQGQGPTRPPPRRSSRGRSSASPPDDVTVRAGHDFVLERSHAGFSGTYASLEFAGRSAAGRRQGRDREAGARDQACSPRACSAATAGSHIELAEGQARLKVESRRPRSRSWRIGAIVNANSAWVLPDDVRDVTLNCRYELLCPRSSPPGQAPAQSSAI